MLSSSKPVSHLWEYRHWEKDTRYYAATLQQDLFGEWQVQRQWGGKSLGSGRGLGQRAKRVVTDYAATYEEARALLDATTKRRHQRGYVTSHVTSDEVASHIASSV